MTCIMFNPAYCTHRFAFPVVPGVLGSIVVSHIRAPDNCLAQRVWYLLSDCTFYFEKVCSIEEFCSILHILFGN